MLKSSEGILSLLYDSNFEVKAYSLEKLNEIVDEFWPEISEHLSMIESLNEEKKFSGTIYKDLACLLASKIYFHLGNLDEALNAALLSGGCLSAEDNTDFILAIVSKAVDRYVRECDENAAAHKNEEANNMPDSLLRNMVENLLEKSVKNGNYKEVIGVALDAKRLDIVEKTILCSEQSCSTLLAYTFGICQNMQNVAFKLKCLKKILELHLSSEFDENSRDYFSITQCCILLNDWVIFGKCIVTLMNSEVERNNLIAFQMAFDAAECASQHFLLETQKTLVLINETENEVLIKCSEKAAKLKSILSGSEIVKIALNFLSQNNKTDYQILKNSKEYVRNSICHNGSVISNAFMNCSTSSDTFLRNNLEWLSKATNWAKFTATASLGVIYHGHEADAMQIMSAYLPSSQDESGGGVGQQSTATSSTTPNNSTSYSKGGALYALGLIYANHATPEINQYLLNFLKKESSVLNHGAALGLGLAAMGTCDVPLYDALKQVLFEDDAVSGEAAAISMGCVMMSSANQNVIDDMLSYARETAHEKILRGLALGIAMVMLQQGELADALINTLTSDKDHILRRAACFTIGLAYCGTANNAAIKKLLHIAVSDVNDDVRRCAVMCIGFLLCRSSEQCPSIVSLLSESYNPHVRYGSAMALGIACAGTGSKEAITLLEPLLDDTVKFVRQGALIASSLILCQYNSCLSNKVVAMREKYARIISTKHEDMMVKFGALLSQGIIDAGGRNMTISLCTTKFTHVSAPSVIGMLVFTQFWFWFPLSHFLTLAFKPTFIVGLNAQLKMPVMNFKSNAKPSFFAYYPMLELPKSKEKSKISSVVLSYVKQQQSKALAASTSTSASETTPSKDDKSVNNSRSVLQDITMTSPKDSSLPNDKKKSKASVKESSIPSPVTKAAESVLDSNNVSSNTTINSPSNFEFLSNPSRILQPQLKYLSLSDDSPYVCIRSLSSGGGVVMLQKVKDDFEEKFVQLNGILFKSSTNNGSDDNEAPVPEPFEYLSN